MSLKSKKQICVADSETDPFKENRVPEPFIWGFYNTHTKEYEEFTDTKDFVDFVKYQNIIVYAHNGGKFDWHFLTQFIEPWEEMTVINGRLAKFKIGECEFRDSYNIIPVPLSAYQKEEIDYAIFEPGERDKPENMEKIRAYLKSDCIYLAEMVNQFIEDYGLNLTQAGAAMKTWAKMTDIKKPKTNKGYYEDLAPYYYGGRVECFQTGIIKKTFKVIDINSAYPFAMKSKHPWGAIYNRAENIKGWKDDKISRAFLTIRAKSMGAFPYRTKKGLRFPNDNEIREFYITGWEYLAARDTKTLENCEILEVKYYVNTIDFCDYVDEFFALKDKASKELKKINSSHDQFGYWTAQRLFAKLFLNSLYGKFASNPENYQEFMTIPANVLAGAKEIDDWLFCKMINEETAVVNRQLEEEKHRYYDVAVAASITGFVRAYLWRNICNCGDVIYCDTDSIAAVDISKVSISPKLGDWEIEAECFEGAVAGKKLYAFKKNGGGYKIASKGVRLEASEIYEIASGQTVIDIPDAPTFSIKKEPVFTPRRIKQLDADEIPV